MPNYLTRVAVIALLVAPCGLSAQSQTSGIVATGSGEAHVTPDRATISIGIQTRAATAAAAGTENARRQRAVIDTLRALGFGSDQISTTNYNVWPETQAPQPGSSSPGAPRIVAYNVTNTIRVDLRRIADVSRAIDASLAKGANEISSLQFYSSKADSARRAALAEAVAAAKADAQAIALAAGGVLGPLVELSSSPSVRPFQAMDGMMLRTSAAKVPTPIEPGEQTISAMVTGRWSFTSAR